MFKYYTHTHTTKYLHCYKNEKCNNYEYNKHNLICRSGYRFTAQHHTKVNIKKLQHKVQNSRNILKNRRKNNNALVVQVIQVTSTFYSIKLWGWGCAQS